ncbi:uncharacterized protein LOC123529262 isoform X2 [Mercenaria mercenaria]|uniref:uncharacterized protein LOC123529262 isoform X2 n=1 Tax=Mercenaria mercenaria TaxID=6596 RepID=UPI00234F557C|nr:uncharacterized protein LOC123529262 isoform X2 [Mercenaria mercenaria]
MSTESVKGSNDDALTPNSDPLDGDSTDRSNQKQENVSADSDGETKIKADTEEHEKNSTPRSLKSGDGRKSMSPERSGSSSLEKSPSSRPESSESRAKSSGEIEEKVVGTKTKKKTKKFDIDPDGHEVSFTLTISIAVPTVDDDDQPDINDLLKKKKRVFEAPRAQNYYHLEYYLVPEKDELMKTDVVTYGMGAKIYMERHDPVVKKTWHDGEVTWIAWTQKHKLYVTKDVLLKLYDHTLELRIWDTKDKVGTRARFDRPKLFKLPSLKHGEDVDDLGGVKGMVMQQCRSFTDMQPKKSREIRPLPKEITFQKPDPPGHKKRDPTPAADKPGSRASGDKLSGGQGASSPTPHTLVGVVKRDDELDGRSSFSRLGRLADHDDVPTERHDSRASKVSSKKSRTVSQASKSRTEHASTPASKARHGTKSAGSSGSSKAIQASNQGSYQPRRRNRKAELAAQTAAENIKRNGVCMVPIRMAVLFSGVQTITNRLDTPVLGLEDMFVTLQLNKPLLNQKQKQELNPMIIKIHSITNMPSSPMTHEQLKDRCMPAYCRYSFFNLSPHVTLKRPHASSVYYDDINVILAGTFEPSEFRQYLNGPPLEIEVHDRDRKLEEMKLKATLFGDDLEDEKISNVGTVASRRTLHNPFKDKSKIWDPYGVARVDLSDLLLGNRYLYIKVPVHSCPPPDLLGLGDNRMSGKVMGLAGAVDGPVDSPMPAGHYMSNNTMLKIKVELSQPLVTPYDVAAKDHIETTDECPFGRIVFKFDYKNTHLLNQLQMVVTKINARALELDDMPQHVVDAALSTYKLSGMQQQSRTLDIITGFQVLDGSLHLFVLEGLRDQAIKEVWESLPQPENSDVTILYHSNLSFSERLYGPLDVDLCRVKLHEPLRQIVQQPLLYVRDMVPKPCFEALVKLHELLKTKSVKDAVRNQLFPTADMVVSMSKEFGVPFTTEDFEELQVKDEKSFVAEATTATHEQSFVREPSKYWEPIDNLNISYMEKLVDREKQGQSRDFMQEHREEVKKASEINKREKEMNKPLTVKADVTVAHNYSTQSLNSTELAKEKLKQMLAKDPDTRYTYCQDYLHSMTVVPVNVEALKKQEKLESEARWKTEEGWIYPGMKSTLEANEHPRHPHTARVDELHEKWRENILHVGLLQAPLDRDRYPWDLRDKDLELYKVPEINFGVPEHGTIHLAGEKLRQEKLAAKHEDLTEWKSKIVVDDTRQYFHRCLTETELRTQGRKASNQVARLQGLLKDRPNKLSLRRPGMNLRNIPPLNVVLNPSVDTDSRLAGITPRPAVENEGDETNKGFKPGPYLEHSWVLERNKVPAIDYEHDKFNQLKGRDFNVYHKERTRMWRRPIVPLTEDERDNHLFRIPDDPKRFRVLPELSHSLGDRSLTQPQISTVSVNASKTDPPFSQLTAPTSFNDPSLKTSTEPSRTITMEQSALSQPVTKQPVLQLVN